MTSARPTRALFGALLAVLPAALPAALLAVLLTGLLASGCAPAIGDSCSTATDCSINGDRVCDTARPGGACTIFGCDSNTCPDDAVCVRFRPDPARLSLTACMRKCDDNGGCRVDDGYRCLGAADLDEGNLAEVVDADRPEATFCVATIPEELP